MKKIDLKPLLLIFTVVILFFGIDCFIEYSNDTYAILEDGLLNTAKEVAGRNARPVLSLFYLFWVITPFSEIQFYYFSYLMAVICLTLALYILQYELKESLPEPGFRVILAFFTIVNVFFINFFSFFEKGLFMLAILTAVLGAHYEKKYFETGSVRYSVISLCLIIFTALDYQIMLSVYAALAVIYAFKCSKDLCGLLKNILTVGVKALLSIMPAILITVFGSLGRFNKSGQTDQKAAFFRALRNLLRHSVYTHDILPPFLWLIPAVFCILICILLARKSSRKIYSYTSMAAVFFTCITLAFLFLFKGYAGYSTARTIYPLALIPGMLMINASLNCDEARGKIMTRLMKASYAVIFLHLVLLCLVFNKKFINRYAVNRLDKNMMLTINGLIREYEKGSGNKISKISFYEDRFNSDYYGDVLDIGVNVSSSMSTDWSRLAALNWYCGTDYTEAEPLPEYREYFIEKDWSSFSEDQLIFEGDTLHLCRY